MREVGAGLGQGGERGQPFEFHAVVDGAEGGRGARAGVFGKSVRGGAVVRVVLINFFLIKSNRVLYVERIT